MRRAIALLVAVASLVGTGTAAAHVTPVPTFVTQGQREAITLVAPNEREARMDGLSVTVPPGLSIVAASRSDGGWTGTVQGRTASWSGCCVAPGVVGSFPLTLIASGEPGDVSLAIRQRYPDGEHVRWKVPLTVLPGEKSEGSLGTVLLVALVGLVVTVGLVVLLWLRRAGPLQER